MAITLFAGGLVGATLVRISPGWDVDEKELDLRRSEQSIQALRVGSASTQTVLQFYASYLTGMLRGDLGISCISREPVVKVIAARAPRTLRSAGIGYLIAWAGALAGALLLLATHSILLDSLAAATSGLLLSVPAACIGFVALWTGIGTEWAVAAVVFPKVFRYSAALLNQVSRQPHVITALARGLGKTRILLAHILRPALNELLSLAGSTTALAFGAAIPLEVVCDSPGLGQLAWQAAMARDLPVLVSLTLLVTLLVKTSAMLADLLRAGLRENCL